MNRFIESARMTAVQAPVIPVVGQMIRDNPGTISLGQGVVHYPPPLEAIGRMETFLAGRENHTYGPVEGMPELLDRIATRLSVEDGISLAGRRVVVTAGGNMAFLNAVLATTDPGDEVVLLAPYYFNHEMAVRMLACVPVVVPCGAGFLPDVARVAAALTPRTRAVVTISPNNPSGAVYPREKLAEVNRLCRERGVYHIHDEAYEHFAYGAETHVPAASLPDSVEHTISLHSLSKSYGMASWRVGWMVIPGQLLGAVAKVQDTNLICPPVVSQHAACGALEAGRAFVAPHVAALDAVRRAALASLAELGDLVDPLMGDGAFYFLLHVRTHLGPVRLVERLIREHRVAVIPGNAFGLHDGCYLRVSYGALQPSNVVEGVGRVVAGLRAILR